MATSKEQLFQKIDNLLIDINEQYLVYKTSEECSSAELNLLAANVDFLSAHIKTLHFFTDEKIEVKVGDIEKKIDKYVEPDEQKVVEEIVEENTTPSSVSHDAVTLTVEEYEESAELEKVEEIQEKVPAEAVWTTGVQSAVSDTSLASHIKPAPVSESIVQETQPIVNRIVEEKKEVVIEQPIATTEEEKPNRPLTLNELIQQQRKAGANLTQQFNTTGNQDKIVDLKTAVSLNDKLLFIKDLFNGYSLAYNEAIELLNKYDSFAEADAFLQTSYAVKNGWSAKPQTVDKFYAILHKKFMN